MEILPNLYGTPYPFKINCTVGNESPSSVSDNKIMSRSLLMTYYSNSSSFLIELMFKCLTISLLEGFYFVSFRPILFFLILSREVGCLSLWFSESCKISSEPPAYYSILQLALLYFWVDELEEISSDKASPRFMSHFLNLLSF